MNLVVTSTTNRILVTFGVFSNLVGYSAANFQTKGVTFQLSSDLTFIRVLSHNGNSWTVAFQPLGENLVIDSVNGEAPTSNFDLFNKLDALIQ
jgi:hypothetical protein